MKLFLLFLLLLCVNCIKIKPKSGTYKTVTGDNSWWSQLKNIPPVGQTGRCWSDKITLPKLDPTKWRQGIRLVDCEEIKKPYTVFYSGGGLRAMVLSFAAMKSLNKYHIAGKSIMSQTRAISGVSGGGWGMTAQLGACFNFDTLMLRLKKSCRAQKMRWFRDDILSSNTFGDTQQGTNNKHCCLNRVYDFFDADTDGKRNLRLSCPFTRFRGQNSECDRVPNWKGIKCDGEECHDRWLQCNAAMFKRLWSPTFSYQGVGDEYMRDCDNSDSPHCFYGWNRQMIEKVETCKYPIPIFGGHVWYKGARNILSKFLGKFISNVKNSGGPVAFNYGGIEINPESKGGPNYLLNADTYSIDRIRQWFRNYNKKHGKYTAGEMKIYGLKEQLTQTSSAWSHVKFFASTKGKSTRPLFITDHRHSADSKTFAKFHTDKKSRISLNKKANRFYFNLGDVGAYSNFAFNTIKSTDSRLNPNKYILAFDFGANSKKKNKYSYELRRAMKWHFQYEFQDKYSHYDIKTNWICGDFDYENDKFINIKKCEKNEPNLIYAKMSFGGSLPSQFRPLQRKTIFYFPMRGLGLGTDKDGDTISEYIPDTFPTVGGNAYNDDNNYKADFLDKLRISGHIPNFFKCRNRIQKDGKYLENTIGMFEYIKASVRFYDKAFELAFVNGKVVEESYNLDESYRNGGYRLDYSKKANTIGITNSELKKLLKDPKVATHKSKTNKKQIALSDSDMVKETTKAEIKKKQKNTSETKTF